jgi:hypothetical protein
MSYIDFLLGRKQRKLLLAATAVVLALASPERAEDDTWRPIAIMHFDAWPVCYEFSHLQELTRLDQMANKVLLEAGNNSYEIRRGKLLRLDYGNYAAKHSCLFLMRGNQVRIEQTRPGTSCVRFADWSRNLISPTCYWTFNEGVRWGNSFPAWGEPINVGSNPESDKKLWHITKSRTEASVQSLPSLPTGRNIGIAEQLPFPQAPDTSAPVETPPVQAAPPPPEAQDQSTAPVAPPTLPQGKLGPLSLRLAEINQLARQSLPIITRHCGTDAACRKDQTAAMHELVAKETANAKALRNPNSYGIAMLENDRINACKVMWTASEDFVGLVGCINEAAPA